MKLFDLEESRKFGEKYTCVIGGQTIGQFFFGGGGGWPPPPHTHTPHPPHPFMMD